MDVRASECDDEKRNRKHDDGANRKSDPAGGCLSYLDAPTFIAAIQRPARLLRHRAERLDMDHAARETW